MRIRYTFILMLIMLVLYPAYIFAATPDELVKLLIKHAAGQTVSSQGLEKDLWKDDLKDWNKSGRGIGSQNLPVIARAAVGDYKWIAQLAKLERKEGIWGRELGSPGFYFYMPVAAKMVALRDAREAASKDEEQAIRLNLRAIWAYEALAAVNTPRTSTWMNLAGDVIRGKGDAEWYDGLTVAVAGERWRSWDYIDHDDHGAFLGWALDWVPRKYDKMGDLNSTDDGWWYTVVAHISKSRSYSASISPEPFGLTNSERSVLRRVVKGDVKAAKTAVGWIDDFGIYKDYDVRIRRTTDGTEVVFFRSTNGNKPAHAATSVTTKGVWRSICPSFYKGTGANKGYRVWIDNGYVYAECDPGAGKKVRMPELKGDLIYEIRLKGRDISFTGG